MTRMNRIMKLTDATPEELLSEDCHHFLQNEIASQRSYDYFLPLMNFPIVTV
jgi:hypothetical protein